MSFVGQVERNADTYNNHLGVERNGGHTAQLSPRHEVKVEEGEDANEALEHARPRHFGQEGHARDYLEK